MVLFTIYHQIHQPERLNPDFRFNPDKADFLWEEKNKEIFLKVAGKNYIPATKMFTDLIKQFPKFKMTLSMSGTFVQQAEKYSTADLDVIAVFQELVEAGKAHNQIELLAETYFHSLTGLFGDPRRQEMRDQIYMQKEMMKKHFGVEPTSARNTELQYNNEIAAVLSDMGFKATLCEYRDDMADMTDPQNPNNQNHKVFRAVNADVTSLDMIVLARDRGFSDDVAYRMSHTPLRAEDYAARIANIAGEVVLHGDDYEHIGEHIWDDKGVFEFWKSLPGALEKHSNIVMANPSEIAEMFKSVNSCPTINIDGLSTSSWADEKRNTEGWLGNEMQKIIFADLERLYPSVKEINGKVLELYRYLTTSCLAHGLFRPDGSSDGDVHSYFSAYRNVDEAVRTYARGVDFVEMLVNNVGFRAQFLQKPKKSQNPKIPEKFEIMKKTPKTGVVIITPETGPLSSSMGGLSKFVFGKTGGLGDVVSAISKGYIEQGINTEIIALNLARKFREQLGMSEQEYIRERHKIPSENIHLVSSAIWGDQMGAYYGNPIETAAEFQRQIVNHFIKVIRGKYNGRIIIHSHDWMAGGIITAYAKSRGIPVLHTVHNSHTGNIPEHMLRGIDLSRFSESLFYTQAYDATCIGSQETAVKNATVLSFVGKKFTDEIVYDHFTGQHFIPSGVRQETKAKYYARSLAVVPNSILEEQFSENQCMSEAFNNDPLACTFGVEDDVMVDKANNRVKFQKMTGLQVNPDAILLYWPSRLDPTQKGPELLEQVAQKVVSRYDNVQIAVVGDPVGGDMTHADIMGRIACASGKKIAYLPFDPDLSWLGYRAATDVFGASLYEPFGQIDVLGWIYGATATNRDTGGYHDKEFQMREHLGVEKNEVLGVLFDTYDANALEWALNKTIENHMFFRNNPTKWVPMQKRIMTAARELWSLNSMIGSYETSRGYIPILMQMNGGKPLS